MKYTDESLMPFGIHKGKQLADVPAYYLLWLHENNRSGQIATYINENMQVIKAEVKRSKNNHNR